MTMPTGARPPRRPEADARRSPPPLPTKSAAVAKKSGVGLVLLGSTVAFLAVATAVTTGVAIWWKGQRSETGPVVDARRPASSVGGNAAAGISPSDVGEPAARLPQQDPHESPPRPSDGNSSSTTSPDATVPDGRASSASSPRLPTSGPPGPPSPASGSAGPAPTGPELTGAPMPVAPATPGNGGPIPPTGVQPAVPGQAIALRPFDDIRRQGSCLTVPPLPHLRGKRVELAKILVDQSTDCTLKLHAPSALIPSPASIDVRELDEGPKRSWQVVWNNRSNARDGLVICKLSLENQTLSCEGPAGPLPPAADLWRWSVLEFAAPGDTELTRVRPVEEVVLAPWSWRAGRASLRLPFALGTLTGHAGLRLKIDAAGLQGARLTPPQPVATTSPVTLEWSDPAVSFEGVETPLSITMQPKWHNGELQLDLICFCDLPEVEVNFPNLKTPKKAADLRLTSKKSVDARKVADASRATAAARRARERIAELRKEVSPRVAAASQQIERFEQGSGAALSTPVGAAAFAEARRTFATFDELERQIDAIDLELENWSEWAAALETSYVHLQSPDALKFELVTTLAGKDVTLFRAVAVSRP